MVNTEVSFDKWFDTLKINVLEQTGVEYRDRESVQQDYDDGRNVYDVIEEIVAEYQ